MIPTDSEQARRGVNGSAIVWDWTFTSVGSTIGTTYETRNVGAFAATARVFPAFEALGFSIGEYSSVVLQQYEAKGLPIRFDATMYLYLERGRLALKIGVALGEADNIPELISSQGLKLRRGYFLSTEPMIPGGRGQRKAVIARAREIYDLGADVRKYATSVEVFYATRGGKYGRVAKTARSSFPLDELQLTVPAPALQLRAKSLSPF